MTSTHESTTSDTHSGGGLGAKVKGVAQVVHGIGENIRGTALGGADTISKTHGSKYDDIAANGRQEIAEGLAKIKGQPPPTTLANSGGVTHRHPATHEGDRVSEVDHGNGSLAHTSNGFSDSTDVHSNKSLNEGYPRSQHASPLLGSHPEVVPGLHHASTGHFEGDAPPLPPRSHENDTGVPRHDVSQQRHVGEDNLGAAHQTFSPETKYTGAGLADTSSNVHPSATAPLTTAQHQANPGGGPEHHGVHSGESGTNHPPMEASTGVIGGRAGYNGLGAM